jgi:hypothetical protein
MLKIGGVYRVFSDRIVLKDREGAVSLGILDEETAMVLSATGDYVGMFDSVVKLPFACANMSWGEAAERVRGYAHKTIVSPSRLVSIG